MALPIPRAMSRWSGFTPDLTVLGRIVAARLGAWGSARDCRGERPRTKARSYEGATSRLTLAALVIALAAWLPSADASLGEEPQVEFKASEGALALVASQPPPVLLVDAADFAGVRRAVGDLKLDFERVTERAPEVLNTAPSTAKIAIIVGTVGHSALIDRLIADGKIDVKPIAGKWESFLSEVVDAPLPGIESALVIAGSDKRGTIYGIYDLSEQIGVSPWYWWADVPVVHRSEIFVRPGKRVVGEPVVKYRGIFLNDEEPALGSWAREKFGGFNHAFYEHVFELLLRLRGNYLWPAMWNSAFNEDDPDNARLADDYGIVMGTSHHEPMLRAQQEWKRHGRGDWDYSTNGEVLREFWREGVRRNRRFESIVTLGMRGDGDLPMSEESNVALLEKIVADQRTILSEEVNRDVAKIPQLWALYKEVQTYYEHGMRVPDDVTLLWCDDNWGNIRRLPLPDERKRSGGAGVYYHVDYVGGPRNYKWLNTVPLTKIAEQMNLAWQYDATRIWILNVGDLKPMEVPIEFFLRLAWNPARWLNPSSVAAATERSANSLQPAPESGDGVQEFSRLWAQREFGAAHADEIAALVNAYTKLNQRRKPELLTPDTYSLVNYGEAESVLAEWRSLVQRAETLAAALAPDCRDAFFQLVLYPVKASANVQELYIAAGRNRLYALQARADANREAERVRKYFATDGELVAAYHALGGGKWHHLMDQVKFGYTYWQQPETEVMPAVQEVRPRENAVMAIAIEGSGKSWPSYGVGPAKLPPLDNLSRGTRWIEVFNRGAQPFEFTASSDQPWITLTPSTAEVTDQTVRLVVGVDWNAVPPGESLAKITIVGRNADQNPRFSPDAHVLLPVVVRPTEGLHGFVETDGHIAIEAPHFDRAIGTNEITWRVLPDFGRTLGGVTTFPVAGPAAEPPVSFAANQAKSARGDTEEAQAAKALNPHLEYDLTFFSTGETKVDFHCAPSLDFQSGEGLRFAVSFDDEPPQIVKLDTWSTLETWGKAVADGVQVVTTKHQISRPGAHVLKFWRITPGVVLERIVIDRGGVRPSYLGPPESPRLHRGNAHGHE